MSPARRSRGTGGLYKRSKDGLWIGSVDLGYGPDGRRRRKVVSAPTRSAAARKLVELRREVDAHGDVSTNAVTVEAWLATWLTDVAPARIAPRTLATYRGYIDRYILPVLGKRRLDRVRPEHIRAMHAAITGAGLSTTTARQAHAILGRAFADARREDLTALDIADRMEPPRIAATDIKSLTAEQAVTLLRATQHEQAGARWAMALLTGARQGECLGLEWDRVDFDAMTVDLAWQLQRLPFRHGCDPKCGHRRSGNCPQRVLAVPPGFEVRTLPGSALVLTRPKSRAGRRRVPMVPALAAFLARLPHRDDTTLVFTQDGKPIEPGADSAAWHESLELAGLPSVKLHAARHTTATLLRSAHADQRTISAIMGHASAAVTDAYLHEDDTLAREALGRVEGMFALATEETP